MIKGLGTDLVEVERVASSINKESGFREMIFSKNEIVYCESNLLFVSFLLLLRRYNMTMINKKTIATVMPAIAPKLNFSD